MAKQRRRTKQGFQLRTPQLVALGLVAGGGLYLASRAQAAPPAKPPPTPSPTTPTPAFTGTFSISGPSVGYIARRANKIGKLGGIGAVKTTDGRALETATIRFDGMATNKGNEPGEGVFHILAIHGPGATIREGTPVQFTLGPGESKPLALSVNVQGTDGTGPVFGAVVLTDQNLTTLKQVVSEQLGIVEALAKLDFSGEFGVSGARTGGVGRR